LDRAQPDILISMSTLTDTEKRYFENLLAMGGGVPLDYTDATFASLFKRFGFDIHGPKYQSNGPSKAKKLRSFWEQEPDNLVGPILAELLNSYEAACDIEKKDRDTAVLERCRSIVVRLGGEKPQAKAATIDVFLHEEFKIPNVQKLPVDSQVAGIIEGRLHEARLALGAGAHLSVVLLCGSVLEAVLLGAANKEPAKFNQSTTAPKLKDGSVKYFYDWTLSELIDTASDVGILKPDVKKFGHGLRDFRNYIHPYQQMLSGFTPDEHTAKVCFQVLKAALASVAGDRR